MLRFFIFLRTKLNAYFNLVWREWWLFWSKGTLVQCASHSGIFPSRSSPSVPSLSTFLQGQHQKNAMLGKTLRSDAHFEQRTSVRKPLLIPGPLRGSQVEVEKQVYMFCLN